MGDILHFDTQQFLRLATGDVAETFVHHGEAPIQVGLRDPGSGLGENGVKPFLAFPKRFRRVFALGNVANVALNDFPSVFVVEIAYKFNLAAQPRFVLEGQILIADKMCLLQLAKSCSAGLFILKEADFPEFLVQQFGVAVAQ